MKLIEASSPLMRTASNAYGLSDHSGTIYPGLLAAYEGSTVVEVHVVFSREGPNRDRSLDVDASVTMAELRQLADGFAFIEAMRSEIPSEKRAMRDLFLRKVVNGRTLKKGEDA
jgi:N-acetylneuraminate synthase